MCCKTFGIILPAIYLLFSYRLDWNTASLCCNLAENSNHGDANLASFHDFDEKQIVYQLAFSGFEFKQSPATWIGLQRDKMVLKYILIIPKKPCSPCWT